MESRYDSPQGKEDMMTKHYKQLVDEMETLNIYCKLEDLGIYIDDEIKGFDLNQLQEYYLYELKYSK